jgi:glycosyltransferase involved in cell wall biosynthesis
VANPLVSVIIPTYDRAKMVARAVASALAACVAGDEVLVVDDGSKDATPRALAPFASQVRYVRVPHGGAGWARNQGIREVRNDLVAFLDSDDEWTPDHLAIHRALHGARPDVAFSFSDFAVEDREGRRHPRYLAAWHRDPRRWDDILGPVGSLPAAGGEVPYHVGDMRLLQLLGDYVPTFTMVAKRTALPDASWFAEDVPTFEDLQCFGRLAFAGPAAFVDRETAVQHGHAAGRLTEAPPLKKIEARLKIVERVWGADAAFQARHGAAYRERLRVLHVQHARSLLKDGRTAEARAALRTAGRAPLAYRLLSWMPGPVVRGVGKAVSTVRK